MTSAQGGAQQRPEAIREEIEQTRGELSETIDAIQEKLSPAHLTAAATDQAREQTVGRARELAGRVRARTAQLAQQARSSPGRALQRYGVPAVFVGLSVAWALRARATARPARRRHRLVGERRNRR